MKIGVIDDLQSDRQILADFIDRYCEQNHISVDIEMFENGEHFLNNFNKGFFEIIFIDIYMNGINGIETAEKIRKIDKNCLLIFSTASEAYAVKSFRVRAFDYLVKPYNYIQFKEIMDLCKDILLKQSYYIEVKEKRIIVRILLQDIIFTDYFNHYIQIHTSNKVIKSYMSFTAFSPMLLSYPQFLSCYRNCIINMDKVDIMCKKEFVMQNGERLPITRAQSNQIKQVYADYIFKKVDQDNITY